MLDISNYYEKLVTDQLWKLMENSEEHFSQAFLEDVACIALNQLPACYIRYYVDKSSSLTEHHFQEMNQAVNNAINYAIEQVKLVPHDHREN